MFASYHETGWGRAFVIANLQFGKVRYFLIFLDPYPCLKLFLYAILRLQTMPIRQVPCYTFLGTTSHAVLLQPVSAYSLMN